MVEPVPAFEALLEHLKSSRGFDFTGYKRSTLMRRVDRRVAHVSLADYAEYVDYLELHTDEFTELFNTILINVTGFFRDQEAWEFLSTQVLPAMVANKSPTQPLRIWSAGCASGEEAYTLAIVLAEMLGPAEFRDRVKIYATDVDEEALTYARHGSYTEREIRGVPAEFLDRYFDLTGDRYVFRKDLRRSVIFGRNDLVQDAPISRIDLLVCRNTLMYFNAETQARILSRFHFALTDTGVLFLGKAEMLLSHGALFTPIELKRRTFRKATRTNSDNGNCYAEVQAPADRTELTDLDLLRTEAMMATPLAHVVVTVEGLVAMANRQARLMFGVSARDVGRPFRDLEISYHPVELRRHIEQAQAERRTVRITDASISRGSEVRHLEVQVSPLTGAGNSIIGISIAFRDVTDLRALKEELEQTSRQLETAHEELQSTNEELDTTNEELQSTVEELEATNEELQSTNDELQTINDEMQERSGELDLANEFLEAGLAGLRAGVVVLNPELHVQVWNRQAQELWGLRQEEALGQHFLNLDIGLPTDRLRSIIRHIFAGADGRQEATVPAVNRRGRRIDVRVQGSLLRSAEPAAAGVILTMEEVQVPDAASGPTGARDVSGES